ncbi:MAG: YvcK family protein [Chloroflexi bacterium]|nr:YvcK family protein [Chloroflexota bacterium]MCL5074746.1 YvcK family protein [Chloroflexota bacterium]
MSFLKWLYPGMHIKRWLLLLLLGITFISLGIAYLMAHLYRSQPFPEFVAVLTLQFIDRPIRGLLFIGIGLLIAVLAFLRLNRSMLSALLPDSSEHIVERIYQHHYLKRGPRVVAIGGGTGLSTLLRGLKEYTVNLTAIVTVADDGGSSGRLRRELGVLPPGDFRQCIVALADVEPLMTKLFQYRFSEGSDLQGHSFGNLFIVAMMAITGSFERAIREVSRVLAVRGRILPSTLSDVTLCAELEDEALVAGESQVGQSQKPIKRAFLQPHHVAAYPEAIRAILQSEMIVVGPGSLHTSILPNLLVGDVVEAIKSSKAVKVYVCNVATEKGETDGFSASDHLQTLVTHLNDNIFDYVIVNDNFAIRTSAEQEVDLVRLNGELVGDHYKVLAADVIDVHNPLHHDPKKLARSLMRIYYDRANVQNGRRNQKDNAAKKGSPGERSNTGKSPSQ